MLAKASIKYADGPGIAQQSTIPAHAIRVFPRPILATIPSVAIKVYKAEACPLEIRFAEHHFQSLSSLLAHPPDGRTNDAQCCLTWDAQLAPVLVRHPGNISSTLEVAKRPAFTQSTHSAQNYWGTCTLSLEPAQSIPQPRICTINSSDPNLLNGMPSSTC